MQEKLINLYKQSFILSRSFIVVSASLFSSVFAYLFQVISARYLSIEEYSELVALFSLSVVINTIMLVFTNGTTKLVAEIKNVDYPNRISNFFFSLIKMVTLTTLLILIVMIATPNFIAQYLNIQNTKLIFVFIIAIAVGNFNVVFGPMLQGLQRFKAFSFYTFVNSFSKFIVALAVMYLGLNVIHTFVGLIISTIFSIIIGGILLKKNIILKLKSFDKEDISTLLKYSLGSILILASLNFLQNNDIIFVKHYFDSNLAGIYASLTVIGKIVFFAASPVAIVMLPICAERYKHGGDVIKPFVVSLLIATFISACGTIIYWAFPHLIITMLFGEKYLSAEPYLPAYGFFMLIYTLIYIIGMFLIAISKFKLGSLMLVGIIIQAVGIAFYHNSLMQVINVSIFAGIITLIILGSILIPVLKPVKI